jgi:hypothetical protein
MKWPRWLRRTTIEDTSTTQTAENGSEQDEHECERERERRDQWARRSALENELHELRESLQRGRH